MLKAVLMGAILASPWAIQTCDAASLRQADGQTQTMSKTHQGKVVSVSDDKLVMTDNDGKNEHTHKITQVPKVILGGKAVKLTDLKKGDSVKVTTTPEGVVTMVEAMRSTVPTK